MRIRKPKAVICDIDGCLLDSQGVLEEAELNTTNSNDKWRYFEKYANDRDKVAFNYALGDILNNLRNGGYKIIFSTARSEAIKIGTRIRLKTELGFTGDLYMRPLDNFDSSADVKAKHLKTIRNYYDVLMAIDDDESNIKMFSESGLQTLKCTIKKKGGKNGA